MHVVKYDIRTIIEAGGMQIRSIDEKVGPLSFVAMVLVAAGIVFLILPHAVLAFDTTANLSAGACNIGGIVIDSHGACVQGAEVRITDLNGSLCRIPDNPTLSGTDGFEFRSVPSESYVLTATYHEYNGTACIEARNAAGTESGNAAPYVEITLQGYVCQDSKHAEDAEIADSSNVSLDQISADSPANNSGHAGQASMVADLYTGQDAGGQPPDSTSLGSLVRFVSGGFILAAGSAVALYVVKKR